MNNSQLRVLKCVVLKEGGVPPLSCKIKALLGIVGQIIDLGLETSYFVMEALNQPQTCQGVQH